MTDNHLKEKVSMPIDVLLHWAKQKVMDNLFLLAGVPVSNS